jgi:hypothetical protein
MPKWVRKLTMKRNINMYGQFSPVEHENTEHVIKKILRNLFNHAEYLLYNLK